MTTSHDTSGQPHEPVAHDPGPTAPRAGRHRVLHLSDTLVTSGSGAARGLDELLHDARFLRDVDLVVVSGDVCTDATSTAYAAVRRRVGAFATAHGASHVYAVGDRDDHTRFAEVLGSGHLAPDDLDLGASGPDGERRGWVSRVDGLRVVTLDTTVPGARHGLVGEAQAQWLTRVLETPAPDGTVLVMHHPPLGPDSHRHLAGRSLHDPERLAAALRGSDVVVVLAGHLGAQVSGMVAGVPVLVAPGAAARTDLTSPAHLDRTVQGAGAAVVELGGPFSPRCWALWSRRPGADQEVELRDGATGQLVAGAETATAVTAAPAPSTLGDRIPRGESPAAHALGREGAWPQGLDSSTRSVDRVPSGPALRADERADPVWLEDATDAASAPAPTADPEPAAGTGAPVVPDPPDPPNLPSDGSDTLAWAPDPHETDTEERAPDEIVDDDSGVLSWAFSGHQDDPRP